MVEQQHEWCLPLAVREENTICNLTLREHEENLLFGDLVQPREVGEDLYW